MKKLLSVWGCVLAVAWGTGAATTIDPANYAAWGANIGWLNWRGDFANGAVIGEYVCSGYIYAANVGWISLGSGLPVNGIQYQNNAANDFGINHDGFGNLRGYAYGANIGWINFENFGAPKIDLATGKISGYIWSANCGWISLSNAFAVVQTDSIIAGLDTDGDGIADAWERTWFGNLTTATVTSDFDGDGMSDASEYGAATNPLDPNDYLQIITFIRSGTNNKLAWTAKPNRLYQVDRRAAIGPATPWEDYISSDKLGFSNVGFDDFGRQAFYRITVFPPLAP